MQSCALEIVKPRHISRVIIKWMDMTVPEEQFFLPAIVKPRHISVVIIKRMDMTVPEEHLCRALL